MSTITEFFRKYHAVRGGDAGPDYGTASREALLGQARAARMAWDRNPDARPAMLGDMRKLRAETKRRGLTASWAGICERIGR